MTAENTFEFCFSQNLPAIPLCARTLPNVPEVQLYLFPDALPQEKLSQNDFYNLLAHPPYWAFCWGGGQALARYLLDHSEFVAGRRVWDFGAGSGVAGIVAGLAGAHSVIAVDIDTAANKMALINAQLNCINRFEVRLECNPEAGDVVLAADICYEEEGLLQVRRWAGNGVSVLVAESRLSQEKLAVTGLQLIDLCRVRTFPDLDESNKFDQVFLYRVNG